MHKILSKKTNGALLLVSSILLSSVKVLTGPSEIYSEIKPISINENGEILCKTRFTKNRMGAHMPMIVRYGFCVISKDTIVQFKGMVLNPKESEANNGYESFFDQRKFWDSIFEGETNKGQLDEIVKDILDKKYKFPLCNAGKYLIDKKFSIPDFEKDKNLKLNQNLQRGLYGATSIEYCEERKIHLLYDFGSVLILNNENNLEYDGTEVGAEFGYYNPIVDKNGQEVNIGFDIFKITGVLFVD